MVTYEIAPDRSWIKCLQCGSTSHSRDDIENRYCGVCGWLTSGEFTSESVIGAPVPFRGPSPPITKRK